MPSATMTSQSFPVMKASSSIKLQRRGLLATESKPYNSHLSYTNGISRRRRSTLFDKIYNKSTKPTCGIFKNNRRRRRITEIERCQNLEQRDQYRLLIEQYRKTSLAETERIFFKSKTAGATAKQKHDSPIIDLSEISLPSRISPLPHVGVSFNTSNVSKANSHSIRQIRDVSSKSVSTSSLIKPDAKSSFKAPETPVLQKPVEMVSTSTLPVAAPKTPVKTLPILDWFSPSSPYLCQTFVSDLVSSYGRRERERKRILAEEEVRAQLLKKKREIKEKLLAELLEERLRFTTQEEIPVIAELTVEMDNTVQGALIPHPQHQVLIESFNISITRQHMATLADLNWLNDEIINFYMELIVQRSRDSNDLPDAHAMNTFFYPKLSTQGYKSVRRWTKRVDIFSKKVVFFPIHLGVHWTLAVVDFRENEIGYYDSMGSNNPSCLETLKNYLNCEHLDKKQSAYDLSDWKTVSKSTDEIPQQLNGSDCGVFTCTFAEFISRNAALSFHQDDMPLIRRTMVWEILKSKLTR